MDIINIIYLPSIVFEWAINIAGSTINLVLSTIKVTLSSLLTILLLELTKWPEPEVLGYDEPEVVAF